MNYVLVARLTDIVTTNILILTCLSRMLVMKRQIFSLRKSDSTKQMPNSREGEVVCAWQTDAQRIARARVVRAEGSVRESAGRAA